MSVNDVQALYRTGVLVPPENPTVEPEMSRLLPVALPTATTRLPVVEGSLEHRLLIYNESLASAASSFGALRLDSIYLACTGSSYLVGPGGDAALAERMSAGVGHCLTAAGAIAQTVRQLGRKRLLVVSPYPDWLTRHAVDYWRASGFDVADVVQVAAPFGIYGIGTRQVVELLRTLPAVTADLILLSGTGMPTVEAIAEVSGALAAPVLSSSLAAAYQLAQRAGHRDCLASELVDLWT